MDAPNLTPEQSHELDDLRRRAYGRGAEDLSERESRRLAELEDLAHVAVARLAPAAFAGASDAVGLRDPFGDGPRLRSPDSPGAADDPASGTGATAEESEQAHGTDDSAEWSFLRRTRVALAVGAGIGVVLGLVGAMVLPAMIAPRPDVTLAQTDEQWASQWENLLVSDDVVPESMQGHERLFDVLMVWTADGIYGDRCLVVGHAPTMRISVESCTAADRYPVYDLIVSAQLRAVLDGAYPVGTTLRLVQGEEAVEVYVLDPAEEGRVAEG